MPREAQVREDPRHVPGAPDVAVDQLALPRGQPRRHPGAVLQGEGGDPSRLTIGRGVAVDRHEEVRGGAVGVRRALLQRHEQVAVARQRNLEAVAEGEAIREAPRDVEGDLRLLEPGRPDRAGVAPPVTGVDHHAPVPRLRHPRGHRARPRRLHATAGAHGTQHGLRSTVLPDPLQERGQRGRLVAGDVRTTRRRRRDEVVPRPRSVSRVVLPIAPLEQQRPGEEHRAPPPRRILRADQRQPLHQLVDALLDAPAAQRGHRGARLHQRISRLDRGLRGLRVAG